MTIPTPETPILDDEAVDVMLTTIRADGRLVLTLDERDALCRTVKELRADLKYRCEALEELRGCRDKWLTMLNPSSPDGSVDDAIRDLQSQLEQLRAENERLQRELESEYERQAGADL